VRIKIILVGKQKGKEFIDYELELKTRLSSYGKISDINVSDEKEVFRYIDKNERLLVLDINGKTLDSKEFSELLSGENVAFLIGPHSGFTESVKKKLAGLGTLISLSKLTFPHRLCKVVLVEQIYRGFCLRNNLPYAK
jgi:23S rRNA (pseudouridine1915-N3)-methyltransferase